MPELGPFLFDGPTEAPLTLAFAHGAGAPMDHPFMLVIARGLAERGWRVARFEFPYMQRARATGRRAGPNAAPVLLAHYAAVIEALGDPDRLVIGGKSMGGRIASMLADAHGVRGLFCLGYPFHPPGRPEKLRVSHLEALRTPSLIVQGERDPFGTRAEVQSYPLSPAITLRWLPDGDHSFKPRKSSGHTKAENLQRAVLRLDEFLRGLRDRRSSPGSPSPT